MTHSHEGFPMSDLQSSGGLYKLLGSDARIHSRPRVSWVATSVNSDKAELTEIAKKRGIELVELQNKAKTIEAASGFPTILDA